MQKKWTKIRKHTICHLFLRMNWCIFSPTFSFLPLQRFARGYNQLQKQCFRCITFCKICEIVESGSYCSKKCGAKRMFFWKKTFFGVFHHFLERFDSKNITFFCTTRTKCMKLQNWWFKKHYVFQWKCTQLKNGFLIGANLFRLELLCVCKMASPIVVLYLFVKFMQIHSMFLVRFVAIHNFARNVTRFRICIRNFEWICKNNGHWFPASKFQKINNQQVDYETCFDGQLSMICKR